MYNTGWRAYSVIYRVYIVGWRVYNVGYRAYNVQTILTLCNVSAQFIKIFFVDRNWYCSLLVKIEMTLH